MKFISILIMLMLGFFTRAHADAQIVLTGAIARDGNGELARVIIDYTITSWSTSDTRLSNCNAGQACWFSPEAYVGGGISARSTASSISIRAFNHTPTLGEVLTALRFSIPYTGRAAFYNKDLGGGSGDLRNICIALTTYSPRWPEAFSNCVDIQPTPVTCNITGNTTIDHRTLLDNALNGAQASTQLNLDCNRSASVTVKATRTNSFGVSLRGDSLYSEVKVNGRDATDGINISATGNLNVPLNITSTLKTRGTVAPGPFSGSTVITVSPN